MRLPYSALALVAQLAAWRLIGVGNELRWPTPESHAIESVWKQLNAILPV